ncbi:Maf-like protein [uncultured Clostridium sp.]|jgi:septum formation protein|uniref:Maf-like protein n=1 Tax=uncultured Clostridium sp. TaxID=59620 RepID=UPI0026243D82|nr:Maf-like protein [uncultured Clostridium sp.]
MSIILASKSPRRKELLSKIVKDFEVIASEFDESLIKFTGDVESYVKELAICKAKEVAQNIKKQAIVISADTIVVLENKILGKPKNRKEAECMLSSLSGNNHRVCTGLCVLDTTTNKIIQKAVFTKVKFSKLTNKEIQEYIDTGSPMDKAGAYGIQDFAAVFVEEIEGCYYNVMGLPLNVLYNILKTLDF